MYTTTDHALANIASPPAVARAARRSVRRAAVDAFQRAGVDVGSAATSLGQSPQVMLQYYRQASLADKRRAAEMTNLGAGLFAPRLDIVG